jgi:hypothetical protein
MNEHPPRGTRISKVSQNLTFRGNRPENYARHRAAERQRVINRSKSATSLQEIRLGVASKKPLLSFFF